MKIASLHILLLLLLAFNGYGQVLDEEYETLLLEEEENDANLAFKPVIGAGLGAFSFYGDVNDYFRTPLNGLTSMRLSISRNLGNYFDIEFNGTAGSVAGNQYNGNTDQTINFKTNLFMGGVSLYYNFNHLLKRKRPIHPYISLGAEIIQFTPKADLLDAKNRPYYYWSDGTIRDVEEGLGHHGSLLTRDYTYETDLRELDLYGYGDYPTTSIGIPLDVGLNVTVSDRTTCRLGATLHLAMSDYIDNVAQGGTIKNDIILNTYISLTIDMFSPADEIAAVENFRNLKFTITDKQDADGDGIDDFNDECPETPKDAKVTFRGCPEDSDKDGVPDYIDKQQGTPTGAITGPNGISMLDAQLLVLLYDPEAVKRSEVKLYRKTNDTKSTDTGTDGIPEKFKPVDTNGDRYISHQELQDAIDAIFEGSSTLTPADIYELQEFFFNQ